MGFHNESDGNSESMDDEDHEDHDVWLNAFFVTVDRRMTSEKLRDAMENEGHLIFEYVNEDS
jgi:hypothetical protein